jgi:hypothetical protein
MYIGCMAHDGDKSCDRAGVEALRERVKLLAAEIADLKRAFKIELDSNLEHAEATYQYIADIHDYLMPVVRKVFPGYAAAEKQIDHFLGGRKKPS